MSNDQSKKLTVDIIARIDKLEKGMAKAAQATDKGMGSVERRTSRTSKAIEADMARIGSSMDKANAAMASFSKGLAAGLIGGGVVGALGTIRKSLTDISDMSRDAAGIGISTRTYQELQYAATAASVPVADLADALKTLQISGSEFAATGGGSASDAFEALGYSADQVKEKLKAPDKMFQEIITKLGTLEKASQLRLADEIFGGTGDVLVRFMQDGVDSIEKLREQARATGQVMDESFIQKAVEADRQFKELEATATAAVRNIAVELAGPIKAELVSIINLAKELAYSFQQFKAGNIKEGLGVYWGPDAAMDVAKRKLKLGIGGEAVPGGDSFLKSIRKEPAKPAKITPPAPKSSGGGGSGADSAARAAERLTKAYTDLERRASERIKNLEVERQAMGMSTSAAEALRFETELLNEANRKGLTLSPAQTAKLKEQAKTYGELAASIENIGDIQSTAESVISSFAKDLANGTSAAEAFKNSLSRIADTLISMATKELVKNAFGGLLGGSFGSLLGGGSSSVSSSSSAIPGFLNGFSDGGFTGAGGRNDPKGVVHGGEYVFSKAAVQRMGLQNLESMHRGALRGYASGGVVGPRIPSVVAPAGRGAAPIVNITNNAPAQVSATTGPNGEINVSIEKMVDGALASQMGGSGRGASAKLLQARMNRANLRG